MHVLYITTFQSNQQERMSQTDVTWREDSAIVNPTFRDSSVMSVNHVSKTCVDFLLFMYFYLRLSAVFSTFSFFLRLFKSLFYLLRLLALE